MSCEVRERQAAPNEEIKVPERLVYLLDDPHPETIRLQVVHSGHKARGSKAVGPTALFRQRSHTVEFGIERRPVERRRRLRAKNEADGATRQLG